MTTPRRKVQVPHANLLAPSLQATQGVASGQLREANERLVLAALKATAQAEMAEEATAQLALRVQLDAQVVEVQKLETLGVLAGGVAHDFNNLLTIILGNTDMGLHTAGPDADVSRFFRAIGKAAARASDLTHQLIVYAGKGNLVLADMDLGIVAQEITQLLSASLPPHVTIHCEIPDRLPFVKGDTTQLFQVILNLVTNAAEACVPGTQGAVSVRARSEKVDPSQETDGTWILPLPEGQFATLEVTDTGHGMTPEILTRIFEPFFSTKFVGRGLGLAAVLGILRSHGGGMWVQSRPGAGSTFKIYLPALRGARSLPRIMPQPFLPGAGSLLIVDGDREVRLQARAMAEALGLEVLESRNGLEAVRMFDLHSGEVAVVLMDFKLPPLGGREIFRRMAGINRRIPVVFTSRFSDPFEGSAPAGLAGSLRKPFRAAEFQGLLRRLVVARGPAPSP